MSSNTCVICRSDQKEKGIQTAARASDSGGLRLQQHERPAVVCCLPVSTIQTALPNIRSWIYPDGDRPSSTRTSHWGQYHINRRFHISRSLASRRRLLFDRELATHVVPGAQATPGRGGRSHKPTLMNMGMNAILNCTACVRSDVEDSGSMLQILGGKVSQESSLIEPRCCHQGGRRRT